MPTGSHRDSKALTFSLGPLAGALNKKKNPPITTNTTPGGRGKKKTKQKEKSQYEMFSCPANAQPGPAVLVKVNHTNENKIEIQAVCCTGNVHPG